MLLKFKLEELQEKMERGKLEKADLKLAKVLFIYLYIYMCISIYIQPSADR